MRNNQGQPSPQISITQGGSANTVILASDPSFQVTDYIGEYDTLFAIGDNKNQIEDFIIETITPSDMTVEIGAVVYSENCYKNAMPFMRQPI